jgi:outer membrane protein OmpA-like peptidoglycan-associated protein
MYLADAAVRPEKRDTDWQKVSMEYTATGTELYLTLGNFSKKDLTGSTNTSLENNFLVFFDDISLIPEDLSEKICDGWQNTKDDIYDFNARHQFLDAYIKSYLRNPPDPPKVGKTILLAVDTLTIPDVFFDVNRSELNKKSFHILDSLCASLQKDQIDSIVVQGYTDSTGTSANNERLSSDRATSVANYINGKLLLDKQKVLGRGYGSEKPVADNRTVTGRQLNRRVEIFIYIRQ